MFALLLGCVDEPHVPLKDASDTSAPDDDTGAAPQSEWGTGADGALVINTLADLSTWTSGARTAPDMATWRVTAAVGATLTLDAPPLGLAPGDEVLLVHLQGTPAANADVGRYRFAYVATTGAGLTLTEDPALTGTDFAEQVIVAQRVPQYTDVTVSTLGTITTSPWNGDKGGVLALRASGTFTVEDGGAVSVSGLGFAGGDTSPTYAWDGYQGESYAGPGAGGHASPYNEPTGEWAANFGGGGANVTGGGGNHAGGATAGDAWIDYATAPEAGEVYGSDDLTRVYFGSGGGGVWNGGGASGAGGAGGGILFVAAASVVAGPDAFSAEGASTQAWAQGTYSYGAGGGAGGTVWIRTESAAFDPGALAAMGGLGEASHERHGGDGGYGRVRVDCATVAGAACSVDALAGVASPEVGWSEVP